MKDRVVSPCCQKPMSDGTAFYTCPCGRNWTPVPLSQPTQWSEVTLKPVFSQPIAILDSRIANADLASLRSQLSACQRERERRFPLLDGPTVPWKAVEVHEKQALKNHGQTVKRLAERGGLSCAELWFVMQDKDWEHGKFKEAEILGRELANKLNSDFERAESLAQQLQQMREALRSIDYLCSDCAGEDATREFEECVMEIWQTARELVKGKGESK